MKRRTVCGWIIGVLLIVSMQAVAQEGGAPVPGPDGLAGGRMRMGPGRGGMLEGREGRMGGPGMGGGEEAIIGRLLATPMVAEKLGLSEEQVKTIKGKMEGFRTELETLRLDLEQASIEQARLLITQSVDEAAVMAAVEKAGEIRTKIAKVMMRQLLTVKKELTPEQIEKARTLLRERMEKERERFGAGRDQGEGGPGQRRDLTPEQMEKAREMMRERMEKGREGGGTGQWRRPRERGPRGNEEDRPREDQHETPAPEQAL